MELFDNKPEADEKGPYALRSGPVLMGEEELVRRANSMLGQAMEKNWGAEEALFVWSARPETSWHDSPKMRRL